MSRATCERCTVRRHTAEEHPSCKGHHEPDCPEMFWPSGQRRGTMTRAQLEAIESLPAFRMSKADEISLIYRDIKTVNVDEEVIDG